MVSRPTAIGIVGVIVVIIALILNHEDKKESDEPLKNKSLVAKNQLSQDKKAEKKERSIPMVAKENTDKETTLKKYKKKLTAEEIFLKSKDRSSVEYNFTKDFLENLGLSLSILINIIDPDAIVFGGGVSNSIESLDEVKKLTEKYLKSFNNLNKLNLKTVFLKPKYGDASGVRGAAILSRQNII